MSPQPAPRRELGGVEAERAPWGQAGRAGARSGSREGKKRGDGVLKARGGFIRVRVSFLLYGRVLAKGNTELCSVSSS